MGIKQTLPKDFVRLVFQVLWFQIWIIPMFLWAVLMTILPSRRKSLRNEVVLITGAGNGLGRELAMQFARKGCKLALVDIKEEAVENAANEINGKYANVARAYVANLGIPEDITALAQRVLADYHRVDILVNNAGLVFSGTKVHQHRDHEIDGMFRVNIMSHFWMIREFLPGMLERNHGHVVAISSVASLGSGPNASAYIGTKWAVTGVMQSLRDELREIPNNKVQVSNVCPYFVNSGTDMSRLWNIRMPAISVGHAARSTIDGIQKNKFEFSIPWYHHPTFMVLKIVPQNIRDYFITIFYAQMASLSEQQRDALTTVKIMDATANRVAASV